MDGLLGAIKASSQGLSVQRRKMNTVAKNIANAETTRTPEGGPFRRQLAVFMEMAGEGGVAQGVKVDKIIKDDSELRKVYEPDHPDADSKGYVSYPNVDVVMEMVDLIAASRAYEANATVIEAAKSGFMRTLQILQA